MDIEVITEWVERVHRRSLLRCPRPSPSRQVSPELIHERRRTRDWNEYTDVEMMIERVEPTRSDGDHDEGESGAAACPHGADDNISITELSVRTGVREPCNTPLRGC